MLSEHTGCCKLVAYTVNEIVTIQLDLLTETVLRWHTSWIGENIGRKQKKEAKFVCFFVFLKKTYLVGGIAEGENPDEAYNLTTFVHSAVLYCFTVS